MENEHGSEQSTDPDARGEQNERDLTQDGATANNKVDTDEKV